MTTKQLAQWAVSLHASRVTGSSPLGFRWYLPQEWTDDPARLRQASVPDDISFPQKWQLALALIDQARNWSLTPPPAVLAAAG